MRDLVFLRGLQCETFHMTRCQTIDSGSPSPPQKTDPVLAESPDSRKMFIPAGRNLWDRDGPKFLPAQAQLHRYNSKCPVLAGGARGASVILEVWDCDAGSAPVFRRQLRAALKPHLNVREETGKL